MRYETKLTIGQILSGRYKIIGMIGSGGMSHVHLAEDLRLPGKKWAIKECVTSGKQFTNVQAEAELLICLNHRRLPRIVDFFPPDEDGYSYLIMDYIEGHTLAHYMRLNPGPIPVLKLLLFTRQLLEVLQYLHEQHPPIVYRDMKPSNIMLNEQNELMLIDFGIARSYKTGAGEDTVKLGTVGFAAPEQYGHGQSGPASDLYGLGALILYMATGGKYSQWQSGIDRTLGRDIPASLISVIQRLLRYQPEERYINAAAVLKAISDIETGNKDTPVRLTLKENKTCIIAFLGIAHGLGTTHTSLAMSSYLSRIGTTAWMDWSHDSHVHDRIRNMVEVTDGSSGVPEFGQPFCWNGVHYWKRQERDGLVQLLNGNFQYVILDLGIGDSEGDLEEFSRSDIPLLIASGADWRLEELMLWLRRCKWKSTTKLKIVLPMSGQSTVTFLQTALRENEVYGMPMQSNPFKRVGEMDVVLSELVQGHKENKVNGKRGGFFRKR